jgi:hypothetical protein
MAYGIMETCNLIRNKCVIDCIKIFLVEIKRSLKNNKYYVVFIALDNHIIVWQPLDNVEDYSKNASCALNVISTLLNGGFVLLDLYFFIWCCVDHCLPICSFFLLTVVLSVLRLMASDYTFVIITHFLTIRMCIIFSDLYIYISLL